MYSQNQNFNNRRSNDSTNHTNPSNSIAQLVKSPQNLQYISTQVYTMAKQYYNLELDSRFKNTLLSTVDTTLKQFGTVKSPKISDQQHIENLNKIIVDDCMRYVQQYKSTMGEPNTNPFADLNDNKMDTDHLSKAVDSLAAARGYNFHNAGNNNNPFINSGNNNGKNNQPDFAEPAQDRRLTADELARKLEAERGIFGTSQARSDGMHLHELLGTSKPNDSYRDDNNYNNNYSNNNNNTNNNRFDWTNNSDNNNNNNNSNRYKK